MKTPNNIASFVVRFTQELWQDAQGEPHVQWRGHIRHVQGDEEDRFTDFAEAVAFMQRYLAQLTLKSISRGQQMSQEKILRESFKFWEQFASSYTNMMFEAMERTIKQSGALKEQLDEATERAFKAWQLPIRPDQAQIMVALHDLQQQVQTLAHKVDQLEKALQQQKATESESSKEQG